MKALWLVMAMTVMSLGLVSCRKDAGPVYQVSLAKAEQMAADGDTKGAMDALALMVEDRRFREHRTDLLGRLVNLAGMAGDVEAAARYFKMGVAAKAGAMDGLTGFMIELVSAKWPAEQALAWFESMERAPLGDSCRELMVVAHVKALCGLGRPADALKLVDRSISTVSAASALGMGQSVFDVLLGAGLKQEAGQIPGIIERKVPESTARTGLVFDLRLAGMLADGRTDDALAYLRKAVAAVPDASVITGLQRMEKVLPDKGEALGEELMAGCASRPRIMEAAGSLWMQRVRERRDAGGIGTRLVALHQKGLSDAFVMNQMDASYPEFLGTGLAEAMGPVYEMFDAMYKASKERGIRRRLGGYLLDMGFFLEKYAEALDLVEAGVFKDDPRMNNPLMTSKIRAHLALKEGRVDEAVGLFRVFMAEIDKQVKDREMDMLDETWVTRDMILGLNAKRIGDILAKAGRTGDASKAYTEARGYYESALKEFKEADSKENRKIRKALEEIPSA